MLIIYIHGSVGGLVFKSCLTLVTPLTVVCQDALCLWGFPGKNTGVGCHFLLQGIFPTRNLTWVLCIAGTSYGGMNELQGNELQGKPTLHTFSKFLTKSRYSYSRDASVVALVSVLIVCHMDCGDSILPDFSPHPQQSCSRCTRMNLLKIHLIMSSPPE